MLPLRLLARAAGLLLMTGSAGVLSSCVTSPCERDDGHAVTYTGGRTDPSGTYYETSPVEGPWVRFTSGTRLRLEHGLHETPRDWKAYLSFEEYPEQIAENAGSQVAVEPPPNDQYIEIVNDTCGDFFIRFTAEAAPLTQPSSRDAAASDAPLPSPDSAALPSPDSAVPPSSDSVSPQDAATLPPNPT